MPSKLPLPFQTRKYDLPIELVRTKLVEGRNWNTLFNDPVIKFLSPAILLFFMVALQVDLQLIAENRVGLPEIPEIALQ